MTHPFAQEVFDTIVALGLDACAEPVKRPQFLARRSDSLPNPGFSDFGAPPPHVVAEGRYNHAGHPMIYLADSEETAIAEISAPGVSFV